MPNKKLLHKQLITRRTFIIGLGKIGLLFLLAGRMFYMQFIKKNEYKILADNNRIKTILIPPTRGQIFDLNGQRLAQNNNCFRLLLEKNANRHFHKEIELIIKLLNLDQDQIIELQKRVKRGGYKVAAVILDYLEWNQLAIIEEQKPALKSLFIDTGFDRYYAFGIATAHLIGCLGRPNNSKGQKSGLYDETFKIGKSGVEKFYENSIQGEFGFKRIEINALGHYVRELGGQSSICGQNLHLNIDAELQTKTMQSLSPKGCSAIVIDCNTGGVLICASSPSFDPNQFKRLSHLYWNELLNNPYKPLINKTVRGVYPPGSIFKIITILAALEHGIEPEHRVTCTGRAILGGNSFRCSSHRGHGSLNMVEAIKHSCNSYIYDIAHRTGANNIINVARTFGFGMPTGIDLPNELSGFLPTPKWKKKKYGSKWSLGDTLNLAVGQGFLLSTPMQLARFITAIATNGKLFTPQIAINTPEYTQLNINHKHLETIKTGLYYVMNKAGGTGYLSKLKYNTIQMAGKTGTAQVQAKKNAADNLNRDSIAWSRRNHAIFSGYAPHDNPQYAISIYFDHGGGGGRAAAPIAKKIMHNVLDKKRLALESV
ncbi:MAG: penicillin-binding protein 2 [Rickettsiaceae bacterium]